MLKHHANEENWKCDHCGKQLESTTGYKNHMLMHEEDKKKHACTHCNHRFLYKSQLKRHLESHACGDHLACASRACAGKTFLNKDTLKHYMKVHKKEKRHYLSDHICRQHKDPYECENVLAGCNFTMRSRHTHETLLPIQVRNV